MDSSERYTFSTALLSRPNPSGPINCLLFIKEATVLVSGGDDQILRIWDVKSGECLQEVQDLRWGQITALSWLAEELDKQPVIFLGTGRGLVCTYPFSNQRTQLIRRASTTSHVFQLNDSVEVQTLDPLSSRFAVASHSGQIKMFKITDARTLIPLWSFQVQDIPRSIFFQGDRNDCLVVHTCCLGDVISCDSDTGVLRGRAKLRGGIGSVALSADRHMMAVYDLSTGNFDLYNPTDSQTPITLSVPTETRLIKQSVFTGEDSRTLVCGGDSGTVHVFDLGDVPQLLQSLNHEGPDTFYAVAAYSTADYHFIACGESEEPAAIFIWAKPTGSRAAEDRVLERLQVDNETRALLVAEKAKDLHDALKNEVAVYKEMVEFMAREHTAYAVMERRLLFFVAVLLLALGGLFWVTQPKERTSNA